MWTLNPIQKTLVRRKKMTAPVETQRICDCIDSSNLKILKTDASDKPPGLEKIREPEVIRLKKSSVPNKVTFF